MLKLILFAPQIYRISRKSNGRALRIFLSTLLEYEKKTNDLYLYRGRRTIQDHTPNVIDPEIEDLTIILQ